MMIVDTHAHLYLDQFVADLDEVMTRAIKTGVKKILLPNIDSTTIDAMYSLEQKYPMQALAMMGLHPCYVKDDYKLELEKIKQQLDRRTFVAIGEIGIDLYWDKQYIQQQKDAFITQVQWAYDLKKPIVIHARESTALILDLLEELNLEGLQGVFHCFSGDIDQLDRIRALDFYIGIGGVITYKNSNLGDVLSRQDLSSIVLETDAPYLSPVPYRGKRNESSYLPKIVDALATMFDLPADEVCQVTTKNAYRLFGLHDFISKENDGEIR